MEDLATLMKRWYFTGYKQAQEDTNTQIQDPLAPGAGADAPEINILRRGWPDPLKRAKKEHEKLTKKVNVDGEDVKAKATLTKHSPEVTVG